MPPEEPPACQRWEACSDVAANDPVVPDTPAVSASTVPPDVATRAAPAGRRRPGAEVEVEVEDSGTVESVVDDVPLGSDVVVVDDDSAGTVVDGTTGSAGSAGSTASGSADVGTSSVSVSATSSLVASSTVPVAQAGSSGRSSTHSGNSFTTNREP